MSDPEEENSLALGSNLSEMLNDRNNGSDRSSVSKEIERSSLNNLLSNGELTLVSCDDTDVLSLHPFHVVRGNPFLLTAVMIRDLSVAEVLNGETEAKRGLMLIGVRTS